MKLIDKLNDLKSTLKPTGMHVNADRAKSMRTWVALSSFAIAFGVIGYLFFKSDTEVTTPEHEMQQFAKIKDPTFTDEDNKSALTQQQSQMNAMQKTIEQQEKSLIDLTDQFKAATATHHQQREDWEARLKDYQAQTEALSRSYPKSVNVPPVINSEGAPLNYQDNITGQPVIEEYAVQSFRVIRPTPNKPKYQRTSDNYIPTGAFCKAIVLGGADASAAVDAQGEASPMLFKVMERCYLPNGKRTDLKGAMITGSVYGKISSERGLVRLEHLSLVRQDNSILEIPVEGTAFDIGGKNGIRGIPVMRNDKVIVNAGLSGMLAGLGNSAQQYSQSQSVSPMGQTSTIDSAKILPNALGAGAATAFGEISKYYIELAKQYSPVIQLNAGAIVDIVFLKGFPLQDEQAIEQYEKAIEKAREDKKEAENANTLQIPTQPNIKLPKSLDQEPT